MLRSVLKQAQELALEKMEGISVILNDDDMTDIQVRSILIDIFNSLRRILQLYDFTLGNVTPFLSCFS